MYHPDKIKRDLGAKAKFQNLAQAYCMYAIDPSTLYAMVFGSDQFIYIMCELQLASFACDVDDTGTDPRGELMNSLQRKRVSTLVLGLLKTLKPYVEGVKRHFLIKT